MENASKALLIAGAILLSILIIAIGMSIYNSASSTINDSVGAMSTQEKDAFNNQFTSYENAQTGSKVKALIGVLIANSNTYQDEMAKIPSLGVGSGLMTVKNTANAVPTNVARPDEASSTDDYVTQIGLVRNAVEEKHTYWVEMVYGTGGIIDNIIIYYYHPSLGDASVNAH